jgi:hypothetical protein
MYQSRENDINSDYSVILYVPGYLSEYKDEIISEFEIFIKEFPWWDSN